MLLLLPLCRRYNVVPIGDSCGAHGGMIELDCNHAWMSFYLNRRSALSQLVCPCQPSGVLLLCCCAQAVVVKQGLLAAGKRPISKQRIFQVLPSFFHGAFDPIQGSSRRGSRQELFISQDCFEIQICLAPNIIPIVVDLSD